MFNIYILLDACRTSNDINNCRVQGVGTIFYWGRGSSEDKNMFVNHAIQNTGNFSYGLERHCGEVI